MKGVPSRFNSRLGKAVLLLLGALALMTAVACGAGWYRLRRSLPETAGRHTVPGLSSEVVVTRDAYGIPAISAASERDLFFGLGYVHAQDRFFQMEMQRRTGQGRLSEIGGARLLEQDRFLRTAGFYRAAEAAEAALLPETRAALTAYAEGVNAWLQAHRERLPPEFDLLRLGGRSITPEPWRPADSLVWLKMLAFNLAGPASDELLRASIIDKVGPERAADLFPPYPAQGSSILGLHEGGQREQMLALGAVLPGTWSDAGWAQLAASSQGLGPSGPGIGSNSLVVAPSRTVNGFPLLANDLHVGIQNPSVLYAVQLEAPGLRATGMSLPGLPGLVLGRNDRIAWGITNMAPDTHDLYLERLDPRDPGRYLAGDESLPFTVRQETLRAAGQEEPVVITVRETRHGPVIREDWGGKGPVAWRWTGLDPGDTTLDAMTGLLRASNRVEFREALRRFVTPPLNFVYADVEGHIAYNAAGRIPIRAKGDGTVIVPGWDGQHEWTGFVPFDELPRVEDPPEGFIVTANQRPVGEGYRYQLGSAWALPYRADRMRELLLARPKVGMGDLDAILGDVISLAARDLLPVLLATPARTPREQQALERLRTWDQSESPESVPAAIFIAWYSRLLPALVEDDLGPELYAGYARHRLTVMMGALAREEAGWCDDRTTGAAETCPEISARALGEALDDLTARLGPDPEQWRLGRLRGAKFFNPVGSGIPLLGRLFTRTAQVGGDAFTVRATPYEYRTPYDAVVLSACFAEFDLSPRGESRLLLPLGQSGHPLSPHFDDHLKRWLETAPVPVQPWGAPGGTRLVLSPAP